jgi:large subunit ribosomal protein L31
VKEGIHPEYHKVLYVDSATGEEWLGRSTLGSQEKREIEGEQVPVIRLEISSVSHPFWTGKLRSLDSDGKIDRFNRRYGNRAKKS